MYFEHDMKVWPSMLIIEKRQNKNMIDLHRVFYLFEYRTNFLSNTKLYLKILCIHNLNNSEYKLCN